jgi:hypothetical protein
MDRHCYPLISLFFHPLKRRIDTKKLLKNWINEYAVPDDDRKAWPRLRLPVTPMIERALRTGIKARYVLMDSWFGVLFLIAKACKHLHVIMYGKTNA